MIEVSDHVSYNEVIRSNTASRLGLNNEPTEEQLARIKLLCKNVFEPLRKHVGAPIRINSIYRGPELNKAVNGSFTSDHCANIGAAMDLDDVYGHMTNAEMFYWIEENVVFDQLIWEYGDDVNPDWVHVSFRAGANRNMVMQKRKGQNYEMFNLKLYK